MTIIRVNLNLAKRSVASKISYWGLVKADITGNSNFTTPLPPIAAIDTEVNKLALAASAAQSGDHSKIAAMKAQENKVDNLLHQLANYIESLANNAALSGADAKAIIASSGMNAGSERSKAAIPDAPTGIKGTSIIESEIEITFLGAKHARAYMVEISSDLATISASNPVTTTSTSTSQVYINWQITNVCLKPKITLSGLNSGTKYGVRITSIGTAGRSAPSTIVVVKVL